MCDPIIDSQMFMQYCMYVGPTNALGCLSLTIGQITILQYQLASMISITTTDFEQPLRNWSWNELQFRSNPP